MSVIKEEREGWVNYAPRENHKWLGSVSVNFVHGIPRVEIFTKYDENAEQPNKLAKRKVDELIGRRQLSEDLFFEDGGSNSCDSSAVVFNASSPQTETQIGKILEKSEVPNDIRELVMTKLQEIWAK